MKVVTVVYYLSFFIVPILLFQPISVLSGEPAEQTQAPDESQKSAEQADANPQIVPPAPKPIFGTLQTLLEKSNSADETFWLTIEDQPILILKHWPDGRKRRGKILMLHSEGEHADHPRSVRHLAKHFTELGWEVFTPNIPLSNYPIEPPRFAGLATDNTSQSQEALVDQDNKNSAEESDTQLVNNDAAANSADTQNSEENADISNESIANGSEVDTNKTNILIAEPPPYFSDPQAFQSFFNNILQQTINEMRVTNEDFILIAFEQSAFWILELLSQNPQFTHIVFIQPELPTDINDNLQNQFQNISLPYYVFFDRQENKGAFNRAFDRRLWRNDLSRENRRLYNFRGIEKEQKIFAKLITGWVESSKK